VPELSLTAVFVFTLLEQNQVVGACALIKENENSYQLARMAVSPEFQGKGYGDALIYTAFAKPCEIRTSRIYLLSSTILAPAIALYSKYGFTIKYQGQHPDYQRCNIIMEITL
jgi:putative acetyltransferase